MFGLSVIKPANAVNGSTTYDALVDQFNQKSHGIPLYVASSKTQLSEQQSLALFKQIDALTEKITKEKQTARSKQLLLERAVAYSALQDFESAISDLTAVLQLDDKNALAYWQRAVCESMMTTYAQSQGQQVQFSVGQMRADFDEAIKNHPKSAYLFYNRGNMHAANKEYNQAIDDYTQALRLDSRFAEALYNRGILRCKTKHVKEGIADLSKAGELGLYDAYSVIKHFGESKEYVAGT